MRIFLPLAAAGILVSATAMAQNAKRDEPAQTEHMQSEHMQTEQTQTDGAKAADTATTTGPLRQQLRTDLQNAGFTNVRVVPDSFLVQAKDKAGQPVAMIINPHSMTEVIDAGSIADNSGSGAGTGAGAADNDATASGDAFTTVPETARLGSKVVGTDVYNDNHQDIGTIKDIAYGNRGVKAYIIGVGGFLGVGDRYVAVRPSAVQFNYDQGAKAWHASMNTTADQLKAAPEYKYPGEG